jgi:hypothetical protein
MKKITFKRQIFIGIMLIAVGNILALILHEGLCANIAWVLYGLVLIINPVYPERYNNDAQKAKWGIRIAGFICILVGVLTRYVV